MTRTRKAVLRLRRRERMADIAACFAFVLVGLGAVGLVAIIANYLTLVGN